jgi:hypothetical protein
MMKKIFTLALLAVTVLVTLSSCRDDEIAEDLAGIWEGEVAQAYFLNRYSTAVDYQSVDIEFYKNPYRYAQGDGIEYDYTGYDRHGNCYYYVSRFVYEVRNGRIYMDYDDRTRVVISRYSLSGSRFSGTFNDYYSGEYLADFDLYRVDGYYYNTHAGSWHARFRSGDGEAGDSVKMIKDDSYEAAHQRVLQRMKE